MRFLLEAIRPELQQYFIERNYDGRPFDRDTRTVIYERAKGIHGEQAFGTERDVDEPGYECLLHIDRPARPARRAAARADRRPGLHAALRHGAAERVGDELRRAVGATRCAALNGGAALGGFAHDTGEGGLTKYHLESGGDLDLGDRQRLLRRAHRRTATSTRTSSPTRPRTTQVKCVSLKLSQGAKPGIGGVLPGREGHAGDRRGARRPAGREVRQPAAPPGVLDAARARAVHRPDARAGRRQAGRVQALRRLARTSSWRSARRWSRRASRRTSSSSTAPRAAPAPRRWSSRTTSARR